MRLVQNPCSWSAEHGLSLYFMQMHPTDLAIFIVMCMGIGVCTIVHAFIQFAELIKRMSVACKHFCYFTSLVLCLPACIHEINLTRELTGCTQHRYTVHDPGQVPPNMPWIFDSHNKVIVTSITAGCLC